MKEKSSSQIVEGFTRNSIAVIHVHAFFIKRSEQFLAEKKVETVVN